MARLIEAVSYERILQGFAGHLLEAGKTEAAEAVNTLIKGLKLEPTVDAVEVVHGRWEYYSTTMMECSNCKRHTARHRFKYCPHCGSVMEDKYNDE